MNYDMTHIRDIRVELHNESMRSNSRSTSTLANAIGVVECAPSPRNFQVIDEHRAKELTGIWSKRIIRGEPFINAIKHPVWFEFRTSTGGFSAAICNWSIPAYDDSLFILRRFRRGSYDSAPYECVWSKNEMEKGASLKDMLKVQYVRTVLNKPVSAEVHFDVYKAGFTITLIALAAYRQLSADIEAGIVSGHVFRQNTDNDDAELNEDRLLRAVSANMAHNNDDHIDGPEDDDDDEFE